MSAEQSAERIYHILTEALSSTVQQRRSAEAALRDAEEKEDYFASLAVIAVASDEQAEPQVRWLAAVCGKNSMSRSWRRHSKKNAVTDDERQYVRDLLLSGLGEPHSTIATQISVWISFIARTDFPDKWPDVMNRLADAIQTSNPAVAMHALVTLDMVLKQLASRRLLLHRQALYRVAPKLFELLYGLFCTHIQVVIQNQGPPNVVQLSFESLVRCLKSFRRILNYGCAKLSDIQHLAPLLSKLVELPDVFLQGASGGTEVQTRLSLLAAKLVRCCHERHPIGFHPFLPTFLKLYFDTVVAFNSEVSSDRTCFQAAKFLRNVATCALYEINGRTIEEFKRMGNSNIPPSDDLSTASCRSIVLSFFDENRTNVLIEAMISRVFVLTKRELDDWSNDPETLVRDEEAAEWGTENLRNQCEELFKHLVIRDKKRVVPMVLHLTETMPPDKPLLLDACYRAVGRVVYDVQGAFDFDVWLKGKLGSILAAPISCNLGERIIQARTAWLVSQFTEQLTRDSRRVVTPLLVQLMTSADQDKVIALTATKALQTLVEDLGFNTEDFAPHLEPCLTSCFRLIHCSESFETKRDLFGSLSSFLSRCSVQHLVSVIDLVACSLPQHWAESVESGNVVDGGQCGVVGIHGDENSSGNENLMRTSIVILLTVLISRTGCKALQSNVVKRLVFPVIEFAVNMKKGYGGTYMMEEGCELWAAVVAGSTEYTEELRLLFPQTQQILGVDFDNLREVFNLIESYALLGGEAFMREYGNILNDILSRALRDVKDRGCLAAVDILDTLLILFPQDGVRFIHEILKFMLNKVISNVEGQVVIAAFISLIARASLENVSDTERLVFEADEEKCVGFIDATVENFDVLYRLPRRKLGAVALCGLTKRYINSGMIQDRMGGVLNTVVQVLSEEQNVKKKLEKQVGGNDFENLLARIGEDGAGQEKDEGGNKKNREMNGEDERRRILKEKDIIERLDLRDACTDMMTCLKAGGEERYQAVLRSADGTVLQQLEKLLQK